MFSSQIKQKDTCHILSLDQVELAMSNYSECKPIRRDNGVLKLLFCKDRQRFILTINEWNHVLTKCLHISSLNIHKQSKKKSYSYSFQTSDRSYTLTVKNTNNHDLITKFEKILRSVTNFIPENGNTVEGLNESVNEVSFSTAHSEDREPTNRVADTFVLKDLKNDANKLREDIKEKERIIILKHKKIEELERELLKRTRLAINAQAELEAKQAKLNIESNKLYDRLKKKEKVTVEERERFKELEQKMEGLVDKKVEELWDKKLRETDVYRKFDEEISRMGEVLKEKRLAKFELENRENMMREELEKRKNELNLKLESLRKEKEGFEKVVKEMVDKKNERAERLVSTEEEEYNYTEEELDAMIVSLKQNEHKKVEKEAYVNYEVREFIVDEDQQMKLARIKEKQAEILAEHEQIIREHLLMKKALEELMNDDSDLESENEI